MLPHLEFPWTVEPVFWGTKWDSLILGFTYPVILGSNLEPGMMLSVRLELSGTFALAPQRRSRSKITSFIIVNLFILTGYWWGKLYPLNRKSDPYSTGRTQGTFSYPAARSRSRSSSNWVDTRKPTRLTLSPTLGRGTVNSCLKTVGALQCWLSIYAKWINLSFTTVRSPIVVHSRKPFKNYLRED